MTIRETNVVDIFSLVATGIAEKARENPAELVTRQSVKSLGPERALRFIRQLALIETPYSRNYIKAVAMACPTTTLEAISILSRHEHRGALRCIGEIALFNPWHLPEAIDAMADSGLPNAPFEIGKLISKYPQWVVLAFDRLKTMNSRGAALQIYVSSQKFKDALPYGIECLSRMPPEFGAHYIKCLNHLVSTYGLPQRRLG